MDERKASAPVARPLHAVLVAGPGRPDGAVKAFLDAAQLPGRIEAQALFLGDDPLRDTFSEGGVPAKVVSSPGGVVRSAAAVVRTLRALRPEVVLAAGKDAERAATLAAWLVGVRVVLWPAGSAGPWARLADHVVGNDDVDPGDGGALTSRLCAVAGRPGAGLGAGPPVSVITTVFQEGRNMERLMEAVVPQLGPDDEFVIVDGGSSDRTLPIAREWAERDARLRVIESPGANISKGRNVAITEARHSLIACTDAGCIPVPGWLGAMRTAFAEPVEPPDLVAGVYRTTPRHAMDKALAAACHHDPDDARHPSLLARIYTRFLGRVQDPTRALGRSLGVKVEAWRRAGGFPEHLAVSEDITFSRAVAASGGRAVLALDAEVGWEPRPNLKETWRMYYSYGRWDGHSRDSFLVARDLVRAAAYLLGPALLARGGRGGRALALAGAALYLSLPVARALRDPEPLAVLVRLPIPLSVMDLAKALGCLNGLRESLRS